MWRRFPRSVQSVASAGGGASDVDRASPRPTAGPTLGPASHPSSRAREVEGGGGRRRRRRASGPFVAHPSASPGACRPERVLVLAKKGKKLLHLTWIKAYSTCYFFLKSALVY